MILEELKLKSWRGYRSETTFRFAEGLNLLVGPNEAGKSTLFEAIARSLFDRHTSRSAELRRIQPLGSSLGPEAQLVLRKGDKRYRVIKRFLEAPRAELWMERDGRFELDHEGDKADEALRRLLRGDPPRGRTRPAQRGLGEALWYLQTDDGIPKKTWNEALREGLLGLLKVSLSTGVQDSVIRRLEKEYRQTFTSTGRLSAKSELAKLESELPSLSKELDQRHAEMARAERYRGELEGLDGEREAGALELERASGSLAAVEQLLAQSGELASRQHEGETRLRDARRTVLELEQKQARLEQLRQRLGALEERQEAGTEEEVELRAEVREHRRTAERHARRWEDLLSPKLESLRGSINELRSKLRIEQLEREQDALELKARRARQLERQLDELATQAPEGASSSVEEITEVLRHAQSLFERSRSLFERARSSAARVSFHLAEDLVVEARPETSVDSDRDEHLVTRPTIFRLGEHGTVRVRSGDDQVARLDLEAREAARELEEVCGEHGASDLDALRSHLEQERGHTLQRQELTARLAELGGEAGLESEQARLREVRRELVDLRRRSPQAVLPGLEGWAEDRTLEQIWELEQEAGRLEMALKEEREGEQRSQQICLKKNEELVKVSRRSAGLRAEIKSLQRQIDEEARSLGSERGLEQDHAQATAQVLEHEAALSAMIEEHREKVERPRKERQRLQAQVAEIEEKLQELSRDRTDRLARIEEVTALSLDARIGDLEGRIATRSRRLEVIRRRAEATKLLRGLFQHLQDRQAEVLSQPVATLVNGWLQELTGQQYAELQLNDELLPLAVLAEKYESPLPLESLSYGLHEQVAVLLRLAIAVRLSQEEPQLVILDDRLVNADDERMPLLCRILEEAAEHCQIVLATCREAPYSSLSAHTIRVGGHTGRFPRLVKEVD